MPVKPDGYYPTPKPLIEKMWGKVVNKNVSYVLEPSAGKGNIVEFLNKTTHSRIEVHCIEKDPTLQATLRGKGFRVIDQDFLKYDGEDKYDLIIGNPPFSEGEYHLQKAIDILYSGEIVFLLNAETIKNPFSESRKSLVSRLKDLNADVEYLQGEFEAAERKTAVEVALIHIEIKRDINQDLFSGFMDGYEPLPEVDNSEGKEVGFTDKIDSLVQQYKATYRQGIDFLVNYRKRGNRFAKYLKLSIVESRDENNPYTSEVNSNTSFYSTSNRFLREIRADYWSKVLSLDAVKSRLTKKKREEFYETVKQQGYMDFNQWNIRTFIQNLIAGFDKTLSEAVEDLFDSMTVDHSWYPECKANKLHFDGWKTNKAFKVNKKVILPMGGYRGNGFYDVMYNNPWKVSWDASGKLADIDLVMGYFSDGNKSEDFVSIEKALTESFEMGITRKIESTHFIVSVYKKGTIHLTFKDDDVLRRFNITACKSKGWLPFDYGKNEYKGSSGEIKMLIDNFEGEKKYKANTSGPSIGSNVIMIG